jgi:hypothetical protein
MPASWGLSWPLVNRPAVGTRCYAGNPAFSVGYDEGMSQTTILKVASIPCFFFAYHYGAHGRTLDDSRALAIGILFLAVGITLVAYGVWVGRRDRRRSD